MAVTVPTAHPWPDPGLHIPGREIIDPDTVDIGQASNYLDAHGLTQPVISQGWTDSSFVLTSAGAFTTVCRWRIPEIGKQHASVNVGVYAQKNTAGTATIRFASTNGAATRDITVNTNVGWHPNPWTGTLACGYSGSAEEILLQVQTSDANTVTVQDVLVEYPDLTSLTVPPPSGETIAPVDDDEVDEDSPLSSGLGDMLRINLDTLESRPKVYYQWSRLAGITVAGVSMATMNRRYYRAWCPINPGTGDSSDFALTVNVYGGVVGADRTLHLQHGPGGLRIEGDAERGPNHTVLTLAADAANPKWHTFTVRFPEQGDLPRAPMAWSHLDIDGILVNSAEIYAVSIWGR